MNISEISKQKNINLEADVVEVSSPKIFTKFGRPGKICTAILKDSSGTITLALWDEQVEEVKAGDKIRVINGYIKEWRGEKQISIGRYGKIEVI